MGLNLGSTAITKMYLGGTQLSAVYLGVQSLLGAPEYAFRVSGTHVRLPESVAGGTNRSTGHRTFTYFPEPVSEFFIVIPTFYTASTPTPVHDVALPEKLDFQVAVDEAATQSMTLPAGRPLVKWGGADYVSYDPAANTWYKKSDLFTLSTPRTVISLLNIMEYPASVTTIPANMQPRNTIVATSAGKFEKQQARATSLIAEGWATNTTSLGAETIGGGLLFAPFVVAKMTSGKTCVVILGSSLGWGIGVQQGGAGAYADQYGDARGNRSWGERYIDAKLGHHLGNLSKPSDQLKYYADPANTPGREALLQLFNPTHVLLQLGSNDPAGSTAAEMAADATTIMSRIKTYLPAVKFVPSTLTPKVINGSNMTALDGSDQTVLSGFGPGSTADTWNSAYVIPTAGPFADNPGRYLDAYSAVSMDGAGGNTFKWRPDATTVRLMSYDGSHVSGDGAEAIKAALPAISPFD